jgi:hypothetical protein
MYVCMYVVYELMEQSFTCTVLFFQLSIILYSEQNVDKE